MEGCQSDEFEDRICCVWVLSRESGHLKWGAFDRSKSEELDVFKDVF
jgi:hypothetical protein